MAVLVGRPLGSRSKSDRNANHVERERAAMRGPMDRQGRRWMAHGTLERRKKTKRKTATLPLLRLPRQSCRGIAQMGQYRLSTGGGTRTGVCSQ
jgi:hypothetical protein